MSDNTTQQYLTFGLGEEVFALETGSVREVIELVPVTRIPKTPPFMRGVINLRGHAVPVVDLRIKFDMPQVKDTVNTCIIIVDVEVEGDDFVHVFRRACADESTPGRFLSGVRCRIADAPAGGLGHAYRSAHQSPCFP